MFKSILVLSFSVIALASFTVNACELIYNPLKGAKGTYFAQSSIGLVKLSQSKAEGLITLGGCQVKTISKSEYIKSLQDDNNEKINRQLAKLEAMRNLK